MFISQRSRRAAAAVSAGAVLALGLSACSAGDSGDAKASDVKDLTIVAAASPWTEGLKTLAPKYKEETGISIKVETYGNEQLNDNYKVKLNAQSADFDVMVYQVQDVMREFSRNGWLADMTDYVKSDSKWDWSDFQASARDAVTLDGVVYGVPVMTEREIVYYRKDLLESAGIEVPKTLDDLESAVAKLNDPSQGVFGIAMRGARVPLVTQFSSFLYSFGGDFQNAKGKATIDSPEAIKAYEFYGNLLNKYGPPGATNMNWVEASALFAQGKAAFYIDADSQAYTFLDKEKSSVVDTVGFAQFPEGPAGSKFYNIVPWSLGINAYSKKKDAAWDFIKWVSDQENTKWLLSEQTVPGARESAWNDSKASANFPEQLVEIVKNAGKNGVGHDRPQLEQVAAAREIVGGPAVAAIEGDPVASQAKTANTQFQDLLDSEK